MLNEPLSVAAREAPTPPSAAYTVASQIEVSAIVVRAPGRKLGGWWYVHPHRRSDAQNLCETALDLVEAYEAIDLPYYGSGQSLIRFPSYRVTVYSRADFRIAVAHRVAPGRTFSKSINRMLRAVHRAWPGPKTDD